MYTGKKEYSQPLPTFNLVLFAIYYKNWIFLLHKMYFKNSRVYQTDESQAKGSTTKMQIYMVNLRAENIQLMTKSYIF